MLLSMMMMRRRMSEVLRPTREMMCMMIDVGIGIGMLVLRLDGRRARSVSRRLGRGLVTLWRGRIVGVMLSVICAVVQESCVSGRSLL